jgi:hypothetical protein
MLFDFCKYKVKRSPVFRSGVLYRPEVLVRVISPTVDVFVRGLVDTGADSTLFPRSIAESLGISLDDVATSPATGFTGDQLQVAYGRLELEVAQRDEQHRWSAVVGFVDYPRPEFEQTLLGRVGFLDEFTAVFDTRRHLLELTAK